MRRKLSKVDLTYMRIPRRYWGVRLGLINEDYRKYVYRYLKGLDSNIRAGKGVLLFGPNGVGKTGAIVVVAKEVRRRGYTVLFVEGLMLMEIFLGKVMFEDGQSLYERMLEVDYLVIDDLGKGTGDSKGFLISKLEGVLRARYDEKKVTSITTNMTPRELSMYFSESGMSILKAIVTPIHCEGRDMRLEFDIGGTSKDREDREAGKGEGGNEDK